MSHKDANHGHLRLMLMRSRKEIVDYESWAGILSPNRKLPTQLNLLISSWLVRVTRIYLRQSGCRRLRNQTEKLRRDRICCHTEPRAMFCAERSVEV